MGIKSYFPDSTGKQFKRIVWIVFLFTFAIQTVKMNIYLLDGELWASQIQYFLSNNPKLYDFHGAYGHPGTTLLGVGCLFHLSIGLSTSAAVILSVSLIISIVTAMCAGLCFLLQPQSLWWITTGFILSCSRLYSAPSPPTAIVMPFITLIVLSTCWILKQNTSSSQWVYFIWGVILGLSGATRLDISIFVGVPLFILLFYTSGIRVVVPVLTGGISSFFLADPFLWFMPIQHIVDLLSKFTLHYSDYGRSRPLPWFEWAQITFAVISIASFLNLYIRRRMFNAIPAQVIWVFLWVSLLSVILLTSSKFQAIRYLFPLIIVWEVFLPLFLLSDRSKANEPLKDGSIDVQSIKIVLCFVIPTQVIGYFLIFIN